MVDLPNYMIDQLVDNLITVGSTTERSETIRMRHAVYRLMFRSLKLNVRLLCTMYIMQYETLVICLS